MKTPILPERVRIFALLLSLLACAGGAGANPGADGWLPLFNGKDLAGWTVKVAKHPLGVNHLDTFRVEDGMIKAKR